jgi:aminoglycoside phosphotransferase (APT) family kinase protein
MDLPFPKPKSIVTDYDKNIGKNYVIMSYIPGASLGSVWHKTNDRQREVLIKDICNVLKNINEVDPSILDDKSNSWQESRMQKAERIIGILKVNGIFNETQVQKATEAIKHYAPALAGNERKPVYWDIHFDNFLVNDNYELQGVVDLENVIYAALDYPLFVIQRMTDEPEKMLREEDEQYARTEDYARVKGWYEQYYPEMFDFPNLAVRLKFYQLLDALHLLRDWSHNKELWDKFEDLVNT